MGFNVLDWHRNVDDRRRRILSAVAHMLLSESARFESSTGSYFQNQAHNLLTGIARPCGALSGICRPAEPAQFAPDRLRAGDRPCSPCCATFRRHSASAFIRETLGVFTNMTEQTFSGVYSTASKDTQWLSLDDYAALVCGNDRSNPQRSRRRKEGRVPEHPCRPSCAPIRALAG
jgi:type IV secretion system protein VirD4